MKCRKCGKTLPINVPIYQRKRSSVCKCPEHRIGPFRTTVTRTMYCITARKKKDPTGDFHVAEARILPDLKTYSSEYELHRKLQHFDLVIVLNPSDGEIENIFVSNKKEE